MTNILVKCNGLFLLVVFALGLLLIGYQIAMVGDNGYLYLIGTGTCLFESIPFANFVYPNRSITFGSFSI